MWFSKTHIVLPVGDASKSATFYEALLGGPPTHRSARLAVFEFDSPPLVLTVEERSPQAIETHARLALVVADPQHVGAAAIRLRRAGIRLRVQDQGIEADDPDGNPWRVRFVPSTSGPAVLAMRDSGDNADESG
jgi:catechol 2,3-dioxygenase-like lactoylglutathione lyase family enzyme